MQNLHLFENNMWNKNCQLQSILILYIPNNIIRAGKEIYAHKRTYTYSHIYEGGVMRENIYIYIR
jgi:hypothetical protein